MGNSRYTLIGLLAFTLLVRGGILVGVSSSLRADPDGYRRLAENLVAHGTFGDEDRPTAFRPPLYPLALSACVVAGPWSRATIGALHLALGLATVWLVFRMVGRCGSRGSAILAGLLTACDPILVWQSTLVMTETMAAFWAALAITLLIAAVERPRWHRALGVGMCFGVASLCRPTFLPFAAVVGVVALVQAWRKSTSAPHRSADPAHVRRGSPAPAEQTDRPKQRLGLLGLGLAGLAIVLLPWIVRNQIQFGRPIVATTHGGYTLLLGNNPYFYEYLRSGPWGVAWDVKDLEQARAAGAAERKRLGESGADRLAYEEARENIRREPGMFLYSCVVRVGRLWSPVPHQITAQESTARRAMRYAVGLWYLVELPLAALGVAVWIRRREQAGGPGWILLALSFTAVHALYWTDMRMRAPLMPGVAMAAAAGIVAMVGWVRNRTVGRG